MTHLWGGHLDKFVGKKIFSVDEIKDLEFDKIFIANAHYKTLEQVLNLGILEEKIFVTMQLLYDEYKSKNPNGRVKFAFISVLTQKCESVRISDEEITSLDGNYFFTANDHFRAGTLYLLAEEIKNRNVSGELAELGVFRGDFAKYLNELFPDRTLNLFDTFEGFDQKDTQLDVEKNIHSNFVLDSGNYLKNTSVEIVMSKMKHPEKIELHKGYFPDTIPAEEKTFAFVSLDADLYQPIFEGLKYFYPRLSTGGYIMLHDYNDIHCRYGIHQAVENFEKEFGHIAKIPLVDRWGSLVIPK